MQFDLFFLKHTTDFFQHIRVILECSFWRFIRWRKRCAFDGSNPMVPTTLYWVRSCLLLRNFITQTFVTFQLPTLLCCRRTRVLGCFGWCLSLLRAAVSAKAPCAWWVRAQSSQLLTWLLLECVQAGISPAAECQLRVCVICEGGFSGRTGFSLPHLEVFWILERHGNKETISYHENAQYMIHLIFFLKWSLWTVTLP